MASRSLLAKLSPNGDVVAVVSPTSKAAPRISLVPVNSEQVRTTLTSKGSFDSIQVEFPTSSRVVALLDDNRVMAWDLERGVVDYEIKAPESTSFSHLAVGHHDMIGLLVRTKGKLQVHMYQKGKLHRKIKGGGKNLPRGLAVTKDHFVIRHEHGLKVLSAATGKKMAKAHLSDGNKIVAIGNIACTTASGKLILVDLDSGKTLDEAPTHAEATGLEFWRNDDQIFLSDGIFVYKVDDNKMQLVSQLVPKADLEYFNVSGKGSDVVATLYRKGQMQTRLVSIDAESVTVEWLEREEADKLDTNDASAGSKRKLSKNVGTLGPAMAGGEAMVSDIMQPNKRSRVVEDDTDDAVEEIEDTGPSIEERLKQLRQAMMDEESEDEREGKPVSFAPKKATTQSLKELLSQALQSSDDGMLELALAVVDTRIVTETCQQIDPELLPPLLNALTTRLGQKPTRAVQLCSWIRAVLLTGRIDSVAHLQPLRNLVQERVEALPALLKLEGRLSMIGKI